MRARPRKREPIQVTKDSTETTASERPGAGSSRRWRTPVLVVTLLVVGSILGLLAILSDDDASSDEPSAAGAPPDAPAAAEPSDPVAGVSGLRLTWSDEFDGDALDESTWSAREPWNAGPGFRNDSEAWLPYPPSEENLSVSDGTLELRALRVGDEMTTAMLTTRDKYDTFTHGVLEARMRIPDGAGLWPAFWLLGNGTGDEGWPATGEIDVFEFVNQAGNGYGRMHSSAHFESDGDHSTSTESVPTDVVGDGEWHTFSLHRTAEFLRFYLDGELVNELLPGEEVDGYDPLPTGEPIFTDPMHIRISLEVGGPWAGDGYEHDEYEPGVLEVDHVRVWE